MSEPGVIENVMLTGATGFVGRNIVRALVARGFRPVCVVRNPQKLWAQHPDIAQDRIMAIPGSLGQRSTLQEAADLSQAAIHLVGIILERHLRGQTFERIHVRGTEAVVDAVERSGIRRYLHMSALGTRADAASAYHRSKWRAEEIVRGSRLEWTVFRPSLIHGPDGDFMRMMKRFVCGLMPPVIPYFGAGDARIQPVSVKDVAECFVGALSRPEAVRRTVPICGPRSYRWTEFYNTCRALMPDSKQWKPMVSMPVPIARAVAALQAPPLALAEMLIPSLGLMRFDKGQVQMSQEDSICDHQVAEQLFDIRMRSFEDELVTYAPLIG